MKLKTIVALFLGLACGAPLLFASPGPPLVAGEQFKFSVSWAKLGAGEIVVDAALADEGLLKVTTSTATRRFARMLLPFDAVAASLYDVRTDRLVSLHERSTTRSKYAEHIVHFDYLGRRANYVDVPRAQTRRLEMPEGEPNDLITALLDTRRWQIKPGEKRDVLVIFDDDFYELTIHALRYEDVETELGSFRTIVLEPRMDKTPPKGMFRKGGSVRVWISQDERQLPVRFAVEFKIGTGVATLVSYKTAEHGAAEVHTQKAASRSGASAAP